MAAYLIDLAPAWPWKPSNLRFVGSHTLHFCYGDESRRTVEWDDKTIAVGRRRWELSQG
jgi:hypothetical protein